MAVDGETGVMHQEVVNQSSMTLNTEIIEPEKLNA